MQTTIPIGSQPLRREFMLYDVWLFINGNLVAQNPEPIEASAPCKAVELFMLTHGGFIRTGHAAIARVICLSCPIALEFKVLGLA